MTRRQTEQRLAWLVREIDAQAQWINDCETNGVSYADDAGQYNGRGAKIRRADERSLRLLKAEYASYRRQGVVPHLHTPLPPR